MPVPSGTSSDIPTIRPPMPPPIVASEDSADSSQSDTDKGSTENTESGES